MCLLVVALLLTGGCGGSDTTDIAPKAASSEATVQSHKSQDTGADAAAGVSASAQDSADESKASAKGNGAELDTPGRGPEPLDLPWKPKLDFVAAVEPECVQHGDSVTLTVETKPEAAVAYQAVYSDNKGGAPPPYGAGYGGNAAGNADATGSYSSSWVVGASAPAGRARVDVFVRHNGKWGYIGAPFDLSDPSDLGCSQ